MTKYWKDISCNIIDKNEHSETLGAKIGTVGAFFFSH